MADRQSVLAADTELGSLVSGVRYVTLHTDRVPTAANEVNGNGYARQQIAAGIGAGQGFLVATVSGYRRIANRAEFSFPSPAGGPWRTAGGCMALWNGVPGGGGAGWLFYTELEADLAEGAVVTVAAGAFGCALALTEVESGDPSPHPPPPILEQHIRAGWSADQAISDAELSASSATHTVVLGAAVGFNYLALWRSDADGWDPSEVHIAGGGNARNTFGPAVARTHPTGAGGVPGQLIVSVTRQNATLLGGENVRLV